MKLLASVSVAATILLAACPAGVKPSHSLATDSLATNRPYVVCNTAEEGSYVKWIRSVTMRPITEDVVDVLFVYGGYSPEEQETATKQDGARPERITMRVTETGLEGFHYGRPNAPPTYRILIRSENKLERPKDCTETFVIRIDFEGRRADGRYGALTADPDGDHTHAQQN